MAIPVAVFALFVDHYRSTTDLMPLSIIAHVFSDSSTIAWSGLFSCVTINIVTSRSSFKS